MYQYTDFDRQFVHQRAAQYRDQLERNLAGTLGDDEFRPLRLQNGWYVQRHAPMLRIAVPYGEISSKQVRALARIAREYDRGYAHFTTRQNCQFNWIPLDRSADVMDLLADVDMHGIQTSGNCIRNITSDGHAGIAPDEAVDPRPYAELLRQWSTLHPEFAFLPRKFKIAITGAAEDRAAIAWHDIGQQVHHVGRLRQRNPVELQVLPRGEVAVAAVVRARDVRQLPQLPARQLAIRHRDAQHRRMALHVPAVLQAQRTELFFAELAGEVALQLIAKLRRACVHELAIEVGVGVHTVSSSL